ncbi:MAG: CHRD domain-containing protein [Candidatus Rokuibacteriota bacterium]
MRHAILATLLILLIGSGMPGPAAAETFRAELTGYEEVLPISTPGSGEFRARIRDHETVINYTLSYEGLLAPVTQAHIHFGQLAVNGGIVVFLCSNVVAADIPAGTPACPIPSGTVEGVLDAGDIIARAAAQGIVAGELAEVIAAIRNGTTYANVHTQLFPSGEIRGQIGPRSHGHD